MVGRYPRTIKSVIARAAGICLRLLGVMEHRRHGVPEENKIARGIVVNVVHYSPGKMVVRPITTIILTQKVYGAVHPEEKRTYESKRIRIKKQGTRRASEAWTYAAGAC